MTEDELSQKIIGAAIEVHRELGGPGLLESVYETALAYELETRGLKVRRQVSVPIIYKGQNLGEPLRIDLLVEDRIIVECKAVEDFKPIFRCQLLTYLRLKKLHLGLLINFGAPSIIKGVISVRNGYLD